MDPCILCWEIHLNSSTACIGFPAPVGSKNIFGCVCLCFQEFSPGPQSWKMSSITISSQYRLANLEARSHQVLDGPPSSPPLPNVQCHTSSTMDLQLPGNFWSERYWSFKLSNFLGRVFLFEPVNRFCWMWRGFNHTQTWIIPVSWICHTNVGQHPVAN